MGLFAGRDIRLFAWPPIAVGRLNKDLIRGDFRAPVGEFLIRRIRCVLGLMMI